MIRHVVILCLLCSLSLELGAQNLVPNPGFETYTLCPTTISELNLASPWISPTTATPDFFHACNAPCIDLFMTPTCVPVNYTGFQEAHAGNGYAGFYTYEEEDYREYIQAPLLSPLQVGTCYEVSFYLSSSDPGMLGVKGLVGAYFSEQAISASNWTPLSAYTPQILADSVIDDSDNWILVRETFEAQGGEKFLTIGHFSDNANTVYPSPPSLEWYFSYFIIDDISVMAVESCENTGEPPVTEPPLETVPAQTVLVMPNIFTPNLDGENDVFLPVLAQQVSRSNLVVTNRWGEVVFEGNVLEAGWDGNWQGKPCLEGTYFWTIRYQSKEGIESAQEGFVVLNR